MSKKQRAELSNPSRGGFSNAKQKAPLRGGGRGGFFKPEVDGSQGNTGIQQSLNEVYRATNAALAGLLWPNRETRIPSNAAQQLKLPQSRDFRESERSTAGT